MPGTVFEEGTKETESLPSRSLHLNGQIDDNTEYPGIS